MPLKSTGIVRQTDSLGRIVLPKGLRNMLQLDEGTSMEIYVDGDKLVLQKYKPGCKLCNTLTSKLYGPSLCATCIEKLHNKVTAKRANTDESE